MSISMRRAVVVLLFVVFSLVNLSCSREGVPIDSERVEVYRSALGQYYTSSQDVLIDMTSTDCWNLDTDRYAIPPLSGLTDDTWESFVSANSSSSSLRGLEVDAFGMTYVSQSEVASISTWTSVYSLSEVGFNKAFTQALVILSSFPLNDPEGFGGEEQYVLLEHQTIAWAVSDTYTICAS